MMELNYSKKNKPKIKSQIKLNDMKREILFRGKRIDNGEWVKGNLFVFVSGYEIMPKVGMGLVESRSVDPDTVGQYTGEHDAKGNKIFENDILQYVESPSKHNYFVVFKNGSFDLYHTQIIEAWRNEHLRWGSLQCAFELGDKFKLEVIGNTSDNPELLK